MAQLVVLKRIPDCIVSTSKLQSPCPRAVSRNLNGRSYVPTSSNGRHLCVWICRTNLKASTGDPNVGIGTIAHAALAEPYTPTHFLNDFSSSEAKAFAKWLGAQISTEVRVHLTKLSLAPGWKYSSARIHAPGRGKAQPLHTRRYRRSLLSDRVGR